MDQIKFMEDSPLKFDGTWSAQADHIPSKFLKAAFHKLYLVHSWIFGFICSSETCSNGENLNKNLLFQLEDKVCYMETENISEFVK